MKKTILLLRLATAAALWLLAMLVTALLIPGQPAEAAFPGQNGSIAFERFGDVYLAAPDGSVARKIDVVGVQANPAVSPDGTRVAYESGRGIWVMNADGSGQRRVSDGTNSTTFADADPAWSPDGGGIVFSRYQAGDSDLWSVDLDVTPARITSPTPRPTTKRTRHGRPRAARSPTRGWAAIRTAVSPASSR